LKGIVNVYRFRWVPWKHIEHNFSMLLQYNVVPMYLAYNYYGTAILYLQKPLATTAGLGSEVNGFLSWDRTRAGQSEHTVSSSREESGSGNSKWYLLERSRAERGNIDSQAIEKYFDHDKTTSITISVEAGTPRPDIGMYWLWLMLHIEEVRDLIPQRGFSENSLREKYGGFALKKPFLKSARPRIITCLDFNNTGCFKKRFTTLKACINLFGGHIQCFKLS
jgi:hypothetical protein